MPISKDELESTLKVKGFVPDGKGSWTRPIRVDIRDRNPGQTSELERYPRDGAVGALQVQETVGGRFLVRVTAFRRRLLDEDNLCEKYAVDLCRYSGALPSDAPGRAKIEVSQEKVGSKEPEFVRIQIFKSK